MGTRGTVIFPELPPTIPRTGWKELFLWAFRARTRVRVVGKSMEPLLHEGDDILVAQKTPQFGDVIVFHHEGLRKIKLVTRFMRSGITVRGLNPQHSTDSRNYGTIPCENIIGVVTSKL